MFKKGIVLILFAIPTMLFSKEYASKNLEILSMKNEPVGVLYKGAKVNENKGDFTLSGWVMDGNEYIIFYSSKDRIKLARLEDEFTKNMKVSETKEDVYGVKWKKIDIDFKLKNSKALVTNENELWNKEEELYQRCGSCHKTFEAYEYTPNQWPSIMKTMKTNAGFSKKETKAVSVYLQYESLKGK
ncbi:hypothetical protein [Malaciobacter marinus]|uniref:Molybdopterin-containing oxidoreductase II, DMSO/TMAO/BSO reductase family, monoheme c-type cytochrome n=1 Tax=Malaciobacter marinus TaxID=505249 RepID=A0A347TNW2_9BACT|nr:MULTISPECIES: hypothetical protein [Malaciobacter]AXX88290.1 molybdopterin-containing oxidoreductase II, DMSO/TMAO/BSO reductase family, monoheme c-type cytochrome [Malaciobacter marinus]PHO11743.1 hypothetical protein CPG38_11355 [Malaciobacter marinus]PHO14627.1 hypothetical protein CPH92_11030 [Malaciobacter marinus]RYA23253.1 hypothetical protein CRU96_08780 [Malaciobacter halophilus]